MEWECVYDRKGNIIAENDPKDAGGLTFAGLDRRSHPDFDYSNPNPLVIAGTYFNAYWQKVHAEELRFAVGEVVANFAVNMGRGPAISLLQTAINVLPGKGSTVVDGIMGQNTLAASLTEDPVKLADLVEDEADARYRRIAQINPRNRGFLAGWLNRDNALEQWWMKLAKK